LRKLHLLAAGTVVTAAATAVAIAAPLNIGPSTTIAPYVLPKAPGVSVTSILTVGDLPAANGYRMVAIPDGLGAYEDKSEGKNSVVVLMNHELGATSGIARAHGQKGAFVSRWVIDSKTLEVKKGKDLIQSVKYYNYASGLYDGAASAFARFCSGSLTEEGQFFAKGVGTKERIYFANEENGNPGRLFGVSMTGEAQQLPRLGLFSWENTLAAQNRSETTLVHGTEDATPGELWIYVGKKTNAGNVFDRAGLTNGKNYVLKISDAVNTDAKFRAAYDKGDKVPFTLTELNWNEASGNVQNAEAVADGGLGFDRMEDGAWDPKHPNMFYFLTTQGGEGTGNAGKGGGLWRVTYKDIENPAKGGTLELLLDGTEKIGTEPLGLNKPDNLGIDRRGNIMIQEDPGSQDPLPTGESVNLSRIVAYRIKDGALALVAQFNPAQFNPTVPAGNLFITQDEESSGIIPTDKLFGEKTWLFDAQVHKASSDPELVENGQLLLLEIKSYKDLYGSGDEGEDGSDES